MENSESATLDGTTAFRQLEQGPQFESEVPTHTRVTLDIEVALAQVIDKLRQELKVKSRGTVINLLLKELLIPELTEDSEAPESQYVLGRGLLRSGLSRRIRPRRRRGLNTDNKTGSKTKKHLTEEELNKNAAKQRLVDSIKKIRRELGIEPDIH